MRRPLAWDLFACAILVFAVLVELLQWPVLPRSLDLHYHLSAASAFERAGGWTTLAFWEAAPAGRPHLYPPFFHVLLWMTAKTGLGWIAAARLWDAAAFPLWLGASWMLFRRFGSPRAAFLGLVTAFAAYPVYLSAFQYPAFTLASVMGIAALVLCDARKPWAAGLCLGLAFYTHTLSAFFTATAFVFWCADREARSRALRTVAVGIVVAAPFLAYQLAHSSFFVPFRAPGDRTLDFDALAYALGFAGAVLAWKRGGLSRAFLSLGLASLVFLVSYPARFAGGHGLLGWAALAGLAADRAFETIGERRGTHAASAAAAGFVALALLAAPVVRTDADAKTVRLIFSERTLLRNLTPESVFDPRRATIYFEKPYREIVERLGALTEPDDAFWSDVPYAAATLGALSGRSTTARTLLEVRPYAADDPIRAARLTVLFKRPDGGTPEGWDAAASARGLSPAGETELVRFYVNPRPSRTAVPKPTLGSGAVLAWAAAFVAAVILAARFEKGGGDAGR